MDLTGLIRPPMQLEAVRKLLAVTRFIGSGPWKNALWWARDRMNAVTTDFSDSLLALAVRRRVALWAVGAARIILGYDLVAGPGA